MPRFHLGDDNELIPYTAQEELDADAEIAQNAIDQVAYDKATGFKLDRLADLGSPEDVIIACLEGMIHLRGKGEIFPKVVTDVLDKWDQTKIDVPDPNL